LFKEGLFRESEQLFCSPNGKNAAVNQLRKTHASRFTPHGLEMKVVFFLLKNSGN
jgi:hypothetical protein